MASKERQTIVVDHVHSKLESPEEQPTENQRQTCGGSYLLSHKMPSKKFDNCCCYHSVHCRTYRSGVCKKISYVNP